MTTEATSTAPTMKAGDRIVWVDCEMTGLDLASDALVEVACVVTDAELVELDSGVTVVIRPPDAPFENMPQVVRDMHTASGLIEEIPRGTTIEAAQALVLDYIRSHVPEPRKAPLAGSSVYVDRGFLARDMPELDAYLHYRLIDVSSIKELVRRWYPRVYFSSPAKVGGHRALADARESIAELRYYRDAVLVPPPGPDTDTARGIAARHVLAPYEG
jgi:oligoribonuclease